MEATQAELEQFPHPAPPRPRAGGWTPDRQRCFLEALARCGSVKDSAALAGMSRESAYRLRRREGAKAFARAWDAAIIIARDLYADELMDKARHGWRETVWYHGEEVGTRERFSPQLLLAALGRLDRKADGLDLAGAPARVAAAHFDDLVACIAEERDPGALIAEQDAAAEPPPPGAGESDARLARWIALDRGRAAIAATAPEDIDISDLDPAEADDWDDLQWERAIRSGLLDRIGFFDEDGGEEGADGPEDAGGDAEADGAGRAAAFP